MIEGTYPQPPLTDLTANGIIEWNHWCDEQNLPAIRTIYLDEDEFYALKDDTCIKQFAKLAGATERDWMKTDSFVFCGVTIELTLYGNGW